MIIVEVCCFMKWDYETFLKQPAWFFESIMARMNMKNEAENLLNKKMIKKNGR